MRALCWHGAGDTRRNTASDPKTENARDVGAKASSCAIYSPGLRLMDGQMPAKCGDALDHGVTDEGVEVGSPDHPLKKGDRVMVPFNTNCGECRQCRMGNWASCQRSNRSAGTAAQPFGCPATGLFGYSHLTGSYAGDEAGYARVPMADMKAMLPAATP